MGTIIPAGIDVDPSTPGGDKKHDSCDDCHNLTFGVDLGQLDVKIAIGGSANIDRGTCETCHGTSYFDKHVHGQDGGYVDHDVIFQTGVDVGQNSQECNECHANSDQDGVNGRFSSWTDILVKHVDCSTCHNYVGNNDGQETPPESDVTAALGGTSNTCITCHTPKESGQPGESHGGHGATDFQWTAEVGSMDTCGSTANGPGCHNDTTADNVIDTIHNNRFATLQGTNCENCHATAGGGPGTTILGPTDSDADARSAGSDLTAVCIDCHGAATPANLASIHHATSASIPTQYAEDGQCIQCHKPDVGQEASTRTVASTGNISMPRNLACNYCHLWWPNEAYTRTAGGSTPIYIYQLDWDPNTFPIRMQRPRRLPPMRSAPQLHRSVIMLPVSPVMAQRPIPALRGLPRL